MESRMFRCILSLIQPSEERGNVRSEEQTVKIFRDWVFLSCSCICKDEDKRKGGGYATFRIIWILFVHKSNSLTREEYGGFDTSKLSYY